MEGDMFHIDLDDDSVFKADITECDFRALFMLQ